MTRPSPALVDLVAGRGFAGSVDPDLVRLAVEHKVQGLLKTAVDGGAGHATPEGLAALDSADTAAWARNQMLAAATASIFRIAGELGIDLAVLKGVGVEARWYSRAGERPSWDIDLLIAPWHRHRTAELVAALQPEHSLLPWLEDAHSSLQSIDLAFEGLPVDLHLDPLKLEIAPTRHPEAIWERATTIDLYGLGAARVLAVEASYLLAALHLNKDRFRLLLGYADVLRIGATPGLDRRDVESLAAAEGIQRALRGTESTVRDDLGLRTAPAGRRPHLTELIWPASTRLLGAEGKARFRYRQFLIPALSPRRWADLLVGLVGRIFPPSWLVARTFPEEDGPYLIRLTRGRWRVRRLRRQRRRQLRST